MIRRSKKKSERARQISELNQILRYYILVRDNWQCNRCEARKQVLQSAHVLSKGPASRLRFEPDNLMTLCIACHLYFWHKSPHEAVAWFNDKYPGRYERLQVAARCAPKLDLKLLLTVWRAEMKSAAAGGR